MNGDDGGRLGGHDPGVEEGEVGGVGEVAAEDLDLEEEAAELSDGGGGRLDLLADLAPLALVLELKGKPKMYPYPIYIGNRTQPGGYSGRVTRYLCMVIMHFVSPHSLR